MEAVGLLVILDKAVSAFHKAQILPALDAPEVRPFLAAFSGAALWDASHVVGQVANAVIGLSDGAYARCRVSPSAEYGDVP